MDTPGVLGAALENTESGKILIPNPSRCPHPRLEALSLELGTDPGPFPVAQEGRE